MTDQHYFHDRNILVTGGSGFIGTHLIQALVRRGANVTGITHQKSPQYPVDGVDYIQSDLTRLEDCFTVTKGVDYVFMAAANSSGAEVMDKTPLVHLTPNVVMNAQMLAAAYENGVEKFCFISSNSVYPLTDFAVTESDANYEFFDKYFVVGWMKRFSEVMCEMYSEKIDQPMKTVVVRPGNLYGPFDKFTWKESKVIPALIRRSIERHCPLVVWGDGLDLKDFLYIEDFVEGLLMAFEQLTAFQPINIASGKSVSIRHVLNTILASTNYEDADIFFDISKPTMIPKRMINVDCVRELTGWTPQTTIEEGIEKTVQWYRSTFLEKTPEDLT